MNWLNSLFNRPPKDLDDEQFYDDEEENNSLRSTQRMVSSILLLPIRLIVTPFRDLFHNTGVHLEDDNESLPPRAKFFNIVKPIVLFPFRLAIFPFKLLHALRFESLQNLVFVLPAILMVGFFAFVSVQILGRGDRITARYMNGVRLALKEEDYPLAKTYYKRIMLKKKLNSEQQFQWANILARTGDGERANEIFNKLAPDDSIGFAPTHALKAISLSKYAGQAKKDPTFLKKLRWHLTQSKMPSGKQSPEILEAWTVFYLASENYDEAIRVLEEAAPNQPANYMTIAQIHRGRGEEAKRQEVLKTAENVYRELLEKDELNHQVRIVLANIVAQREDFDEAEQILSKGFRLQPDAAIKRSASDFYVMMHDRARSNSKDLKTQVDLLVRAMSIDPNYRLVYDRLMRMYIANQKTDGIDQIRDAFVSMVTGDQPTPMGHLAYSNFLWEEGDREKAQFHLEQAYKLDPNYVSVLNNLAWMIAQSENPDLERATKLVKTAIEQRPRDGRFHDTYGDILMKQGNFRDSATELELALAGADDSKSVHQKLGIVYEKLGMSELAKKHREQAAEQQTE